MSWWLFVQAIVLYTIQTKETHKRASPKQSQDPSNYITRENDDMIRALFGLAEPSRKQMSSTSWDTKSSRCLSKSLYIYMRIWYIYADRLHTFGTRDGSDTSRYVLMCTLWKIVPMRWCRWCLSSREPTHVECTMKRHQKLFMFEIESFYSVSNQFLRELPV